jgi:hypothetical protein
MRHDPFILSLLSALVLVGCVAKDPDTLGELDSGDDDPSAESGGTSDGTSDGQPTGQTDDGPDTATEGDTDQPPACPDPGLDLYYPASCPDAGPVPLLPAEGCYQGCAGPGAPCDVGTCVEVQVDPCVCAEGGDCCAACAGTSWLCVEGLMDAVCEQIVGITFESIDELECGLGPMGVELCHWSVEFTVEGDYLWMYSDVGQGGSYACNGGMLTLDNPDIEAVYDPESGVLTWDGVDYVATPA